MNKSVENYLSLQAIKPYLSCITVYSIEDDDDDLPPSASQVRPLKRGEKITLKEVDHESAKNLLKRTTRTTTDVSY